MSEKRMLEADGEAVPLELRAGEVARKEELDWVGGGWRLETPAVPAAVVGAAGDPDCGGARASVGWDSGCGVGGAVLGGGSCMTGVTTQDGRRKKSQSERAPIKATQAGSEGDKRAG